MATEEQKARNRIATAKWRSKNRERFRLILKEYRQQNPDKEKARHRAYRQNNPDKSKTYNAKYRQTHRLERALREAQRRAAGDLDKSWASVLYNDPCSYCGEATEHLDHILPISKGGLTNIDNMAPSCSKCNLLKNKQLWWVFLLRKLKIEQS